MLAIINFVLSEYFVLGSVYIPYLLSAYPQPHSSIPTQHSVEVGQNITMDCPIAVGALRQLYTFRWRKGVQTVDTTGPGAQYSVDPLNKSLTIASVHLDNNGTYYCDVAVFVPGDNAYFVPEEYTKITLYVLEGLLKHVIIHIKDSECIMLADGNY